MLRGIYLFILYCLIAMPGTVHAQKSYSPPPKPYSPPPSYSSPHSSPGYSSPNYSSPATPQPNYNPNSGYSAPPQTQQIPLPPCYPYDCETLALIEEARREFAKCMQEAKQPDGTIDELKLADCVFGWMDPNKASAFAECWSNPANDAWSCFDRAYLSPNEKSSGQYGSGYPSQNYSVPYQQPLPQQPSQPQASLPPSSAQPSEGVHPFWNCNSSSRYGPDNYNDQVLFDCLAGVLSQPQMDRFFYCVNSSSRGYDYCYDQAIR